MCTDQFNTTYGSGLTLLQTQARVLVHSRPWTSNHMVCLLTWFYSCSANIAALIIRPQQAKTTLLPSLHPSWPCSPCLSYIDSKYPVATKSSEYQCCQTTRRIAALMINSFFFIMPLHAHVCSTYKCTAEATRNGLSQFVHHHVC